MFYFTCDRSLTRRSRVRTILLQVHHRQEQIPITQSSSISVSCSGYVSIRGWWQSPHLSTHASALTTARRWNYYYGGALRARTGAQPSNRSVMTTSLRLAGVRVSAKLRDASYRKLAARNAGEMTPAIAAANIKDVRIARAAGTTTAKLIYRHRRR